MLGKDRPSDLPVQSGDDEELVREFRSGSAQALGVIFERYYRLVFATAWRVLRDVGEAEDLTQSVFFEISRKASHFDPAKGPLNKWILTLAYHRSLNRRNYLMTRQFYKGHLDLIGENGEELLSTSLMPAQETMRLVHECLGLLDPRQRQILELVFFKELTFKEIAEQTQQTFGNVRNQYYRSLKRLRTHLSDTSRQNRRRLPQGQGSRVAPVLRDLGQKSQGSQTALPLRAPSVPQSLRKEWAGNLEWRREALAAFERVGAVYFEIVPGGVARIGDLKMPS
jgi:RNA polymerase sigma-70 factor (ECF subfamily)